MYWMKRKNSGNCKYGSMNAATSSSFVTVILYFFLSQVTSSWQFNFFHF